MKTYEVEVKVTETWSIEVEANSAEDAEKYADDYWSEEGDMIETDYEIVYINEIET